MQLPIRLNNFFLFIALMSVGLACRQVNKPVVDFYTSELFSEVQKQSVFPDSKTFVDCTPRSSLHLILQQYEEEKDKPDFQLREFVLTHFELPERPHSTFSFDSLVTFEQHLHNLWPVLTRQPDDYDPQSLLLPLPHPYVVPGGRFSEVYYWDSYFTMLGLKESNRWDLIENTIKNFAFLIDSVGFIPNGNRNYYLSRSQPPFFSLMVALLQEHDSTANTRFLPQLEKEYAFWMQGVDKLQNPGDVFEHVVVMPDGSVLNRYHDKGLAPRPEAFKEDVHVAKEVAGNPETARADELVFQDLRSAAESGWDFSSRWLKDGRTLASIQTSVIIPVDLNCLLYHLERMLATGYSQQGDQSKYNSYRKKSNERRRAILTFFWNEEAKFFLDYNFEDQKASPVKSLAGVFPLYFKLAQPDVAATVATTLEQEFLKPGGLVTTLNETGQQWDAPNGWAPLQWMAYRGLMNYDLKALASEIRTRWLRQNIRVFVATHKMMEKYNVMDTTLQAGGGEYPNQDGFGWTNGVALALLKNP